MSSIRRWILCQDPNCQYAGQYPYHEHIGGFLETATVEDDGDTN